MQNKQLERFGPHLSEVVAYVPNHMTSSDHSFERDPHSIYHLTISEKAQSNTKIGVYTLMDFAHI